MIGSDTWDFREKPFERRALLCFEERSYLQGCLATVRIWEMRGSFRMSGNVWWVMLSDERMAQWTPCKSFPFLTTFDRNELESDTWIFLFFADGDVAVFSTCLKLRIQKVNDYYYRLQ